MYTSTKLRFLAAACFSLAALCGYIIFANAQAVTTPTTRVAVCAYNSSPPTVSTGTFVLVQCDSSGRLLLK